MAYRPVRRCPSRVPLAFAEKDDRGVYSRWPTACPDNVSPGTFPFTTVIGGPSRMAGHLMRGHS